MSDLSLSLSQFMSFFLYLLSPGSWGGEWQCGFGGCLASSQGWTTTACTTFCLLPYSTFSVFPSQIHFPKPATSFTGSTSSLHAQVVYNNSLPICFRTWEAPDTAVCSHNSILRVSEDLPRHPAHALHFSQEPSLPCFISQIRASNSSQTKDSIKQIMCWEEQYPQVGLGFPCFIYCCTSQIYWLRTPENSRCHLFCQASVTYGEVCASKLSTYSQSLFGTSMPNVQQFHPPQDTWLPSSCAFRMMFCRESIQYSCLSRGS